MIKEYTIELKGAKIPNIMEVTIVLESPKDSMGMKTENTFAATIQVKRNASENAITKVFDLATNKDGKKNLFDGKLEFISDDGQKPYKFVLKSAYISQWTLTNPSSASSPTEESFELKVGHMIFEGLTKSGGTAKAEFELPLFTGSK
jgi:hypothetical protein